MKPAPKRPVEPQYEEEGLGLGPWLVVGVLLWIGAIYLIFCAS